MAIELAKAYVQIVPSADGIQGEVTKIIAPEAESAGKEAGQKISGGISSGLSAAAGMGAAALGAITSAGVAATGALASGVGSVAEYGDNIDKMAQKMGISIESYQEWDAVMQHSGTSMETMKASMKTLANAAENGSEAFDMLGISQEEIANMSQEELFERTIAALQNVDDETQRTYLAGKTLGRGATELGALLNTSAEDTQAMRDRVRELGGVMSEDAVKAAAAYQDSLQDMTTAFSGLSRGMLQEFLPSITQIMDGLTEVFNGNSEQGIGMITGGIQSMLEGIGEMLPQMAEIATSIITAIAETFVANLPQIVEMGISIIGTLAGALLESLPLIGEALMGVGEVIVNTVMEQGPGILEQVMAFLDTGLPQFFEKGISFVEQVATGILENLPTVIANFGELVTTAISYLMENMPQFLERGVEMLQNVGQGILDNLPEIISTTVKVLADIIATFAEHLPEFLQKGFELLTEVGSGIISAIPDVLAMLPQIFNDIVSELGSYDWLSIGANIINGIADGVIDAAGGLVDAAIGAVQDAWDGMVNWLGIASPSKKARDVIGKNWALGIGEGFDDNMPEVNMLATVKGTMTNMSGTIAAAPSVVGRQMEYNNDDVVAAIRALEDAILHMSVRMDDGTIAGRIDRELGARAALKARG